MTCDLQLDHRYQDATALVVRPVGVLTLESYRGLRDALLKCAAQDPPAIVIDTDSMRTSDKSALAVFPAVWMRISDWPGVPMALVSARQPLCTLLDLSAVPRVVPTFRSVADALRALPSRRRRTMQLRCEPTSPRLVRQVVEQTCRQWGIPGTAEEAVLVVSELTENMIQHARSDGWLRLELRGQILTIAVADADPRPPRLCPPEKRQGGGRGLVLIARMSRRWGSAPQPRGGKVVWATLVVSDR